MTKCMGKDLLRIFDTQEEYDEVKSGLDEDTVSIIIENDVVNYGVCAVDGHGGNTPI